MEVLTSPIKLTPETAKTLAEIQAGAANPLYGAPQAEAEAAFNRLIRPILEGSGLSSLHLMHYRWYMNELARHWRTRKDRELAFHLEACIRKWVCLGLEQRTVQFLVTEAFERLKAAGAGHNPIPSEESGLCPKPGQVEGRRTEIPEQPLDLLPTAVEKAAGRYARTLRQGIATCRSDGDPKEQTENYRRYLERQSLRMAQVGQVLNAMNVPWLQRVAYQNYGKHLDKLCREYSGRTLEGLGRAAVLRWTSYGLEPSVLRAVAEQVFNLPPPLD